MEQSVSEALPANPPNYRWNMVAFMGDWVFFGLAASFVNGSTVLATLVNQLSGSPLAVGLISTIAGGGWLLPQLVVAGWVSRLRRKKPAIVVPSLIGRPTFLLTGLVLLWFGASRPELVLTVFFVGYAVFNVLDGMCSVPWFDLFSRAIPPARRGRFIAVSQVVSAVLTMGAGGAVTYVLGNASPFSYPANYAVLFFLAMAAMAMSLVSMSNIRETPGDAGGPGITLREQLREFKAIWSADRDFRLITGTRLLLGLNMLASPFYAVFAINVKGVPTSTVGLFLSAQVAGGFVCSLIVGYLQEKYGSRLTTNVEAGIVAAAPITAVLGGFLLPGDSLAFRAVYMLAFAFVGAMNSCFMLGHMNYILEMSPEAKRAIYIGLGNTLTGVLVVVPLIGGWLVNTISYVPLFAVTTLCVIPALALTSQLSEPRRRAAAQSESLPV